MCQEHLIKGTLRINLKETLILNFTVNFIVLSHLI
jgi:hypothetical protein